jgi:arylsulfatase A-like enzyme
VVALAAIGGYAWSHRPIPRKHPSHPNVLIVLWDTTRADHLSFLGSKKPTTPNMDEWSKTGVVFEKAIAPSMWTVPSHASMFTGLTTTTHGADYDYRWLDASYVTLAEWLGQNGYDTYAFSANPNLADNRINLLQGVDRVEMAWRGHWKPEVAKTTREKLIERDRSTEISPSWPGHNNGAFYYNAAPQTAEALDGWLDARGDTDKPFFAYLNYMECHKPRVPSLEARTKMADDPAQLELGLQTDMSLDSQLLYGIGKKEFTPAELAAIDSVYDAALFELDQWTGKLLADLKQRGVLDDTIVVFTSDHGENLGDHHLMGHRQGVYQALVHVPLVISWPGHLKPRRVQEPVSNMDLYYTLAKLAGFEPPPGPQPQFRDDQLATPAKAVFSETIGIDREGILKVTSSDEDRSKWMQTYQTVLQDGWKLIVTSSGEKELYNLINDPDELADQADRQAEKVAALTATLDAWKATVPPYDPAHRTAADGPVDDDAETRKQLAMLGYVQPGEDQPSLPACDGLKGVEAELCRRTAAACGPLPPDRVEKCTAAAHQCASQEGAGRERCIQEVEETAARFLKKHGG